MPTEHTARLVLSLLGTGRPLTLEGHEGPVLCVCSDGVRVLAIGVPGCGTCRQALVRGCSPTMGQWFLPVSATFRPVEQVLTASSARAARLWSSDGDALQKFWGHICAERVLLTEG